MNMHGSGAPKEVLKIKGAAYLVSEKESQDATRNFCTKYYRQHEAKLESKGQYLK